MEQVTTTDGETIMVPSLDAPWADIWQFALTYDAYQRHGGFAAAARIGNTVQDRWQRDGILPNELETLRAALSFQQRRFQHFGVDPQGRDAQFVLAVVETIRRVTGGSIVGRPDPTPPG